MRALFLFILLFGYSLSLLTITELFPLEFEEEVRAAALEFGIPPSLLMALVRVESSFNPYAVSPAGAIGLTQVMPQTAEWIGEKMKMKGDLGVPLDNLRFGAAYLKYLIDRYGDLEKALKAYNVGPKAYEEGRFSDSAERYLKKIELSHLIYSILYKW